VNAGDLYGYTALTAGQYFVGEMIFANQQAWLDFQALAGLPDLAQPFTLRLGRAARRGYGQVVAWLKEPDSQDLLWRPEPQAAELTEPFSLTLLTDTILQDRWGRYRLSFDKAWLAEQLGTDVEIIRQFVRVDNVDTFNNHLTLPRQRDIALVAGSVVGLKLNNLLQEKEERAARLAEVQQKMHQLETQGIGLRRSEGFGQVAFNYSLNRPTAGQLQTFAEQPVDLENLEVPQPRQAKLTSHPLCIEQRFEQTWQAQIAEYAWQKCENSAFAQVGRLLHVGHWLGVATLAQMIDLLGYEQQVLGKDLVGRQKEKYFENEERKPGITEIKTILEKLDETVATYPTLNEQQRNRLRQIGVQMLADKIAGLTNPAKGGTQ
jgi:CRISPR-associated protein Csx10